MVQRIRSLAVVGALSLVQGLCACSDDLPEARGPATQTQQASLGVALKQEFVAANLFEVSTSSDIVRAMTLYLDSESMPFARLTAPPFAAQLDTTNLAPGSHVIRVELVVSLLGSEGKIERTLQFLIENGGASSPVPPAPAPPPVDPVLLSENFESGMGLWQNWGGATVASSDARSGVNALKVGTSTGGAGRDIISMLIPGRQYRLRAYAKNLQPAVYAGVGIKIETAAKQVLLEKPVNVTSTSYSEIVIEFTMPAGAAMAWIYLWKEAGTAYAHLDDVTVSEISGSAPAPTPVPGPVAAPSTRDVLKQPFSSSSIWNMPIGSNAVYVPANIPVMNGYKVCKLDNERIILRPSAPLVDVYYNSVGWNGGDRCAIQGNKLTQVPIPVDYVIPSSGENESAAILAADGRSIIQMQPLTRCAKGGHATSLVVWGPVDIYGDGIPGAHGGSNLSALGGSIRVGELRPGQQGPRHALKLIVQAANSLYKCTSRANCYRWPASTSDGYAVGYYGKDNPGQSFAMRMGALLALPKTLSIASLALETEPARQLAFTLQNYGGYVVDDSYGDGFGLAAESGPDGSFGTQFRSDYGFDFVVNAGAGTPWSRDMEKLIRNLSVVDNNSATSIGGGGTPLQPLAPPPM